ncbi:hypothetical protein DIS24_g9451 [Lasiodiplodia hormozganensis]|uniref:RNA polymerase II assembly factor RTP1 n=1 Tax=Lasiodiplodia hormozganensis TaxID=869390 RepID=A0AA39XUG2_9PEZI|nr:hypothetical protein DIS24_g9451 [Lasiodiplodia hormozganensis]
MPSLREELDAARKFLAPAWKRGNDDVIVQLSSGVDTSSTSNTHGLVLRAALNHLLQIHEADIIQQIQAPPANADGDYDEDSRQTLYGLLDLVAIRGILPSLSPGVAAKHRPRSMIPSLRDVTPSSDKDPELLCAIVDGMSKMLENPGAGLAPLIRERALIDVVAGAGELAFAPDSGHDVHVKYGDIFVAIINKTPVSSALPLLTYLTQPTTPPWLKSQLSKQLSLVPLRPHGVRHTIEFIASSYPQPAGTQDRAKGPSLPLEALVQASKLLSSVPSSMDAESYFTALAPQLLTMLDGVEGQELAKAAALIIGSGILGKKALGAPGAIGWRLFAEPIFFSINPPKVSVEGSGSFVSNDTQAFVAEPELRRALLETFFRLGAGVEQLETLALSLLWDGPPTWTFAPGSDGGIEIRRRERSSEDDAFNVIAQMNSLEQKLATYQELLIASGVEDQDIGDLFVKLTRRWLVPRSSMAEHVPKLEAAMEEDPFQSLITAKLVMGILEKFRDKLAAQPDNMIELVKQLLYEWTESEKARKKRVEDLQRPTYAGLRNIVQQQQKGGMIPEQQAASADIDSSEILPVALSLLNTLLSAPNFHPTAQTSSTLSIILPALSNLRDHEPGSELPPSVSVTAANLTTRIFTLLNVPVPSDPSNRAAVATPTADDQKALQAALADLTSPTAPLRASALSTIASLASSHSRVIDVPQLTLLLLRTSLPDADEYVHLHAIKTLAALASLDPQLVAGQLLANAFVDADETAVGEGGLDARLRIGEVLGRVAADVQESLVRGRNRYQSSPPDASRTVIRKIASAAVRVSSRRGQRVQDQRARQRTARLEERRRRDAEKAWGGEVPSILGEEEQGEEDERDAALLASVVSGWSDTGLEEDVRLRALALSVFTTVVQEPATLALLPPEDVAAGIDIAVGSLALETEERHAVLRRAAVLVVWGLVKAMDKVHEEGGSKGAVVGEGAGLSPTKWEEVERVVGWVRDQDGDAVVKGHAGEVLEALQTWRVKKALGVSGDGSLAGQGIQLTGDLGLSELRGLNIGVNAQDESGQSHGKKLVVEETE